MKVAVDQVVRGAVKAAAGNGERGQDQRAGVAP